MITQKLKMKSKIVTIITFSLVVLSTTGFAAKFYRWTDENGGIHYSDKPDANNTAEPIDIYAPKPSSSETKTSSNQTASGGDEASNENKNPHQANSIEEYCKKLSDNIKTLETKSNITSVDTEGKKTNLSKDEQQKTLEKSKQEYASRCNAQ